MKKESLPNTCSSEVDEARTIFLFVLKRRLKNKNLKRFQLRKTTKTPGAQKVTGLSEPKEKLPLLTFEKQQLLPGYAL